MTLYSNSLAGGNSPFVAQHAPASPSIAQMAHLQNELSALPPTHSGNGSTPSHACISRHCSSDLCQPDGCRTICAGSTKSFRTHQAAQSGGCSIKGHATPPIATCPGGGTGIHNVRGVFGGDTAAPLSRKTRIQLWGCTKRGPSEGASPTPAEGEETRYILTGREGGSRPGCATSPTLTYPGGPIGRQMDTPAPFGELPVADDHNRTKSVHGMTEGASWIPILTWARRGVLLLEGRARVEVGGMMAVGVGLGVVVEVGLGVVGDEPSHLISVAVLLFNASFAPSPLLLLLLLLVLASSSEAPKDMKL
mmetsp:Transcript_16631/g.30104  ORF Transcript_16631/g.30104 Transcript_16631/m.30104 type:complete len:307 (-) Transcript_16631:282-1202(-)